MRSMTMPTTDDLPSPGEVLDGMVHAVQAGAGAVAAAGHAVGDAGEAVSDFDAQKTKKKAAAQFASATDSAGKYAHRKGAEAAAGIKKGVQKGYQKAKDAVGAVVHGDVHGPQLPDSMREMFPWPTGLWTGEASVWGFFKSLIDTEQRYWWAQQWLAGYTAWAIYVGLECKSKTSGQHVSRAKTDS